MGAWPAVVGLYLLAAVALLLPGPFGAHPAWAYNWEGYTAWRWADLLGAAFRPARDILAPTDGLMTDSGQGPLVGLPVALGIALAGFTLDAMRIPVALLAALAVPLLWLLGGGWWGWAGRVRGAAAGNVPGLPLLWTDGHAGRGLAAAAAADGAGVGARARAGARGGWRWRREGLLAGSLLLGIYSYAPVRLLWPLAIVLLGFAAWRTRARRGVLIATALFCVARRAVGRDAAEWLAAPRAAPAGAATGYFHARGEQFVAMGMIRRRPDNSCATRPTRRARMGGGPAPGGQNAADLARLLLDRDTLPAPTDYWNERGRFWPWFLLPFAAVGAVEPWCAGRCGRKARPRPAAARARSGTRTAAAADIAGPHRAAAPGAPVRVAARGLRVWVAPAGSRPGATSGAAQSFRRARSRPLLAGALLVPVAARRPRRYGDAIPPAAGSADRGDLGGLAR